MMMRAEEAGEKVAIFVDDGESSDSESIHSDSSSEKLNKRKLTHAMSMWKKCSRIMGKVYKAMFSKAVLVCILYSMASISMVLANKMILSGYQFRHDMVLLFAQNAISVLMLVSARALGWISFEDLTIEGAKSWFPLNIFFVLMLLTGFYSLSLLSVPMVTIFKNSSNVIVTFGDYLLYGQTVSRGILACLALMIGAAVFAAANDITLDRLGIFWAVANCIVSACYVLYMPFAMKTTKLSNFGKVYYNSMLSLPLIIIMDMLTSNDFYSILKSNESREFISLPFLSTVLFSGAVGFSISLTSFICVRETSPTTYSMVGSMNKIPLSVIGVLMFKTVLTVKLVGFVTLSLLAGILYVYTKSIQIETRDKAMLPTENQLKSG